MRRAVLDIGSNSVKLLVAEVTPAGVEPLFECSRQTRLARGLALRRQLEPAAVAETVRVIVALQGEARRWGAATLRAVATQAAREAENAEAFLGAVRAAAGIEVRVLTGEEEARWGFAGVMTQPAARGRPVLLVDVGGGSTEFGLGTDGVLSFHASHPLGAVRWLETLRPADPPAAGDLEHGRQELSGYISRAIAPQLQPALATFAPGTVEWIGTGGTASVLGAMALALPAFDREAIEGRVLSREEVRAWLERLWSLPLAQRRALPGLPPERADVMLTGTLIYDTLMARLGAERLRMTTRGLRFAALLEPDWPGP